MIHNLRRHVASCIFKRLNLEDAVQQEKFAHVLMIASRNSKIDDKTAHLKVNLRDVKSILGPLAACKMEEICNTTLGSTDATDKIVTSCNHEKKLVSFKFDSCYFTKAVLDDVIGKKDKFGLLSDFHKYVGKANQILENPQKQTVAVEFSSPNIAKPFHAGHLRSTIIGNFIGNIYQALGNDVIRLNYLGDWGTQFGLLGVGYQLWGNNEDFEKNPIQHLFEIYVKCNKVVSEEQESGGSSPLFEKAKSMLKNMEDGDTEAADLWRVFRSKSLEEYTKIYKRLGIYFDNYDGESTYVEKAQQLLETLKENGLLHFDEHGVGYCNTWKQPNGHIERASLVKSDGATLYLTRDLAAILDRYDKYKCDKIHYVVDNGQSIHFRNMSEILKHMKQDWIKSQTDLHIKFGVVSGMSTRKGNVVFLNDILDEAKQRMLGIMESKMTTKATDLDTVAEVLGKSAVIIQDLRERRTKGYDFNWDRMLENSGQTGIFLQYGHARLCSLERMFGIPLQRSLQADCLLEPEAQALILHIAKFDEVINEAFYKLEAHVIVQYLFNLVNLTNAAFRKLSIKNAPNRNVSESRQILFHASRITIANGMRLVGLHPLKAM